MNLWIIGSNGLLGSSLIRLCKQLSIAHTGTTRADVDITDAQALRQYAETIRPSHMINCAAYTDVDRAEKEPAAAYAINEMGAQNCAQAAQTVNAKLIHLSTNYVFNGQGHKTYLETDSCNPVNVYGMSKWRGELAILDILPKACIIRTSWLFGNQGKNIISALVHWIHTNEVVRVAEDQVANLTYVNDAAEMILLLRDAEGIFHCANNCPANRYEVAVAIYTFAKKRSMSIQCRQIEPVNTSQFSMSAQRPLHTPFDMSKLTTFLGAAPRTWISAMEEYLDALV